MRRVREMVRYLVVVNMRIVNQDIWLSILNHLVTPLMRRVREMVRYLVVNT